MKLTRREQDVLELMSQGMTNKEIGKKLYLSIKTVKRHRHEMYQKFGIVGEGRPSILLITSYLRGDLENYLK